MHEKAKDAVASFVAGRTSRRELFGYGAKLGLGAATMGFLLNEAQTTAQAADFDWQYYKGKTVNLLLNKHPYADAIIADLENFKKLTGMDVKYDVFPEDVYFDKITAALSSGSTQYDAFMTGAYQTWQYGPAGWLEDLNEYIKDPKWTNPAYAWDDVLPNLKASTSWSGVPGAALGGEGAKQWAVPLAFELNSITYNKRIFDKAKVEPAKNLPELVEIAAKIQGSGQNVYGIGTRGSRSWATIHPGYLSAFANYGGKDFEVADGKLKAAMNSAAGKEMTALWVDMIKSSGPRNWSTYTWYQVGTDLGAGASGMIYDADVLGYFMNGGDNKEAGNLAFSAFAPNPKGSSPTPNVWIWSLALNSYSSQKGPAWWFVQWATGTEHGLFGAQKMDLVNPVRNKIWQDETFRARIAKSYPGYLEQYAASSPGSKIYFTPQPLFFNLTTEWAASLQRMVAGELPVSEGLDELAANVDNQLKQAGLG
ncbi:carbohydrate ABC transporter substrate-binding protein, CUT1 family [Arboricoccus pini]|uniref:Carbohydrate ABC transporter substrate-binding protein, CUT1 family n=1 Tax=Arboricoccus pini TaxID=1963835 RepID=A0A212RQT3_9PROT|nr:extracellular solute-binding protein [Arboricoccus pini]SNB74818.1 carbohydrate ABC transporter substrate-binding protein, CUT1 family [Arboricoccus pini]